MPRERPRSRDAIEEMGGRYSPGSSSSSSEGTRQERDAVEAALQYGGLRRHDDVEQAPQTSAYSQADGTTRFEISYNPEQIASSAYSPQEVLAHEGTHGVNFTAGWENQGSHGWNMNLPAESTAQEPSYNQQKANMDSNFATLKEEAARDYRKGRIDKGLRDHVIGRANYAIDRGTEVEYPTIVNELVERMQREVPNEAQRNATRTYAHLANMRQASFDARMSSTVEQRQVQGYPQGPLHRAGLSGFPTPGGGGSKRAGPR